MNTQPQQGEAVVVSFDMARFFADLDQVRQARGFSWGQMLRTTGAYGSAGMLHRQRNLTIRTLVRLAVWANLSLDAYIRKEGIDAELC